MYLDEQPGCIWKAPGTLFRNGVNAGFGRREKYCESAEWERMVGPLLSKPRLGSSPYYLTWLRQRRHLTAEPQVLFLIDSTNTRQKKPLSEPGSGPLQSTHEPKLRIISDCFAKELQKLRLGRARPTGMSDCQMGTCSPYIWGRMCLPSWHPARAHPSLLGNARGSWQVMRASSNRWPQQAAASASTTWRVDRHTHLIHLTR
jgi:hypothetical protein